MNKVVLIGNLTKEPELKFTPGTGTAVCNITIAISRKTKNKNGQKEADFIPIVIWGKQAEATANYMSKGRAISIAGRIETRSYDAKDGTKRYVTEIIAEEVEFLGSKNDGKNTSSNNGNTGSQGYGSMDFEGSIYEDEMTPVDDGDIPF